MINREFRSSIQYDPNLSGSYASTNPRTLNVRFGDAALENKAIARNTALHELQHVNDLLMLGILALPIPSAMMQMEIFWI